MLSTTVVMATQPRVEKESFEWSVLKGAGIQSQNASVSALLLYAQFCYDY